MNCVNCGAPMNLVPHKEYFFCEYCSSFYFPEKSGDGVRVLGEETFIPCPVCRQTLVSASISGHRVLHCTQCNGVLLNQMIFAEIVKHLRARATGPAVYPARPLEPSELERKVDCPYCGKRMSTHPYYGPGNIVIDNCMGCGIIWLDRGELRQVIDAPGRDRGAPLDEDEG